MKPRGIAILAASLLFTAALPVVAQETILYNFGASGDAIGPQGGVVFDAKGNIYGTTAQGGKYSLGAVYELSPVSGGGWTEKVLYSFQGIFNSIIDGSQPYGSLVFDAKGNLYGTCSFGGKNSLGMVFQLAPQTNGTWTETDLYDFDSSSLDGYEPKAGLVIDSKGNLYGTTSQGGGYAYGTVFELTPQATTPWKETVYSFQGFQLFASHDGATPLGALIMDAEGNLYGTTSAGGANTMGTVFEVTPSSSGLTEKVLYSFGGFANDGANPLGSLTLDSAGDLYGTTQSGGTQSRGIAFELVSGTSGYTEKILYNFATSGTTDGFQPAANLVFDGKGNLFGATVVGGKNNTGAIVELSEANSVWTEKVVHSFGTNLSQTDGTNPDSNLIFDAAGDLFGTTPEGGSYPASGGTVFELAKIGASSGTATPTFSPGAGTYTADQEVTISDATAGATIHYTTNGTTPTTASTKYTAPIAVSATETIEAIAVASGLANSAVATAKYTINLVADTPVITPKGGTYTQIEPVTITDGTSGATIYYTTNGSAPTTSSTKYTGLITVNAGETLKAVAMAAGASESAVASATYTIIGSPSALSAPATAIATPNATLNAEVNTAGLAGSYVFKYGTSSTALTSTTAKTTLTASTATVAASTKLTGLKTKTTYYYKVLVTTAGGTSAGSVLSFTTN